MTLTRRELFQAARAARVWIDRNELVGRNFPPDESSHGRISIGTMAEMQRAVKVFEQALARPKAVA